jgi:2-amino-4-hydroxy-6-hydroxymethyldihydropteridine diphosphokinase
VTRPVSVAIGLGANLGDASRTVRAAASRLSGLLAEAAISPLYRTEPVGGPAQPDYVNAVVTGITALPPLELLAALRELEAAFQRTRSIPNGPRTLDLDLLLYGDEELLLPDLVVPHPRLAARRFVLAPLADLAPSLRVPGTSRTVAELLESAPTSRISRLPPRVD